MPVKYGTPAYRRKIEANRRSKQKKQAQQTDEERQAELKVKREFMQKHREQQSIEEYEIAKIKDRDRKRIRRLKNEFFDAEAHNFNEKQLWIDQALEINKIKAQLKMERQKLQKLRSVEDLENSLNRGWLKAQLAELTEQAKKEHTILEHDWDERVQKLFGKDPGFFQVEISIFRHTHDRKKIAQERRDSATNHNLQIERVKKSLDKARCARHTLLWRRNVLPGILEKYG